MSNYTLMRAPERGFWHLQKKKEFVESWLPCLVDNLEQDLVLLCIDGQLQASQAMLAILSPTFLLPLMQTQACCGCGGRACARRSSISLQVEVPRQVMVSLLWLCHTGAVTCSDQEATAIREAAVLLGIHLNLEQQEAREQEQAKDMQRAFPSKKRKFIDGNKETEHPRKRLMMENRTPEKVTHQTASKGSMTERTSEERSPEATTSNYTPKKHIHLTKVSNGSSMKNPECTEKGCLPQLKELDKSHVKSMKKDDTPLDNKCKENVDEGHIKMCEKSEVKESMDKISVEGKIQSVKCCPKCAKEYKVGGIEDAKKYRVHARWCGKLKVDKEKSEGTHNLGKKTETKQCPTCSTIYNVARKKKLARYVMHVHMCGKTKSKNIHTKEKEAESSTPQRLVCPKCEEEFDATGEDNIEIYRVHAWKCRKQKDHNLINTASFINQETNSDRCPSCQKMFHKSGITKHMKACGNKAMKILSATKGGNNDVFFKVAEKSKSKIVQVVKKECQNCKKNFKHEGVYAMHIKQCAIKSTTEPGASTKVRLPDKECPKCQKKYKYSALYEAHISKCTITRESKPGNPDFEKTGEPKKTPMLSVKKEKEGKIKIEDSISSSDIKKDPDMEMKYPALCKRSFVRLPNVQVATLPPALTQTPNKVLKTLPDKSPCQICDMSFAKYSDLRNHYTTDHYWARLEKQFSAWERTCKFCHIKFSTGEQLLLHTGNFHCARSLDTYLREEGYGPTSVEWTTKLLLDTCSLCGKTCKNPATLKSHLAMKHYGKELIREFPSTSKTQLKCWKCGKGCPTTQLLAQHLGGFHDEVLKYARKVITVGPDDANIIPVNGFEEEGEKVELEEEDSKSSKRSQKYPNGKSSTISDGEDLVKRIEEYENDRNMWHKEEGDYEVLPKDETESNSDYEIKAEEMDIELMNMKVQDNEKEQTWRKPEPSTVVEPRPFKESEHLFENEPEPQTTSATLIYSTLAKDISTVPSIEPQIERALEPKCLSHSTVQVYSHDTKSQLQPEEDTFSQGSSAQDSPFHGFEAYQTPQSSPVHDTDHVPAAVLKPANELTPGTPTLPTTLNTSATLTPSTLTSTIPGTPTAPPLTAAPTSEDKTNCLTAAELGLAPATSTEVAISIASTPTDVPTTAAPSPVPSETTPDPSTENTFPTKSVLLTEVAFSSAAEQESSPSTLPEPSRGLPTLEAASSSAPELDAAPSALPAPSSPDKLRKDMAFAVKELLRLQRKGSGEHDEVQHKPAQQGEPEEGSICEQQTEQETHDQIQPKEVQSETGTIPECVQAEQTDNNSQDVQKAQPAEPKHPSVSNIRAVFDSDSDSE